MTFYISSNEKMSSSMGKPLHHAVVFPDIKFNEQVKLITDTLDNALNSFNLDIKNFDCLVLDTQGSELEVLKGFPLGLKNIDVIVTEISFKKLYNNSVLFKELKKYLEDNKFVLATSRIHQTIGDGDALFLKADIADKLMLNKEKIIELYGDKFVLGIFIRAILIKFLPIKLVSNIHRKYSHRT